MRTRTCLIALLLSAFPGPCSAQSSQPVARRPEPRLRRWFEFQLFTLGTRYRLIESSADVLTSNHMQYREQIRARLNLDARKRFTINTGFFAGNSFISGWSNTGLGTGTFDGRSHYMRQLFVSAAPLSGVEGQFGGLYPSRGESTEYTSYDEDGYIVGGRLSVRRPSNLRLDELTITHGALSSTTTPNLWRRWDDLDDNNYTQILGTKRVNQMLSASADYTRASRIHTLRGAVAVRFKAGSPISALRYEQYVRTSSPRAGGFAVTAERQLPRSSRLQGGYATVDERYGGLNADRIQRGRRLFTVATVPLIGPVTGTIFLTRAFDSSYPLSNKTRFELVAVWDVLASLRRTGVF